MVGLSDFRPDDRRTLDALLEIYSRRAGDTVTLHALIERWAVFVDGLQLGNRACVADYEADLAVRATLAEIEECLSVPGRQMLLADLLSLDRRFLALTVPVQTPHKGGWWNRLPAGRGRGRGGRIRSKSALGT